MYLLTELFDQRSETVVAQSALEQVILDLLHKKQCLEAVELLRQLTPRDRLMVLAREALEIAQTINHVTAIKALTSLPFEKFERQVFFSHALKALLSISEDAALSLVFFMESPEVDKDVGWMLLANHYIKKNDLIRLEKIYHQLSEWYHRSEIEQVFLKSDIIIQDCQRWMVWFGRYSGHDQRSNIYQYLQQAIIILSVIEDVNLIWTCLPKTLTVEYRQYLLQGLYMLWLKAGLFSRCTLLEEKSGQELEGFASVRVLVVSGTGFEALARVPYNDRTKIIAKVIAQILMTCREEGVLASTLLESAGAVPDQKKQVIEEAIKQCIEIERYDVAILLLPHCDEYACQSFMTSMAESGKLTESQQAAILRQIKFESRGSERVCQLLLPALVQEERTRREEEELVSVRAQYSAIIKLKNVGQKHPKYLEVSSAIGLFTRLGHFQEAIKLCAVFGPSNSRDDSVDRVVGAVLVIQPVDFRMAAEASRLYRDKTVAESWRGFFTVCSQGKDQAIIRASVHLSGRRFVQSLISTVATRLLHSDNPNNAVELMKSSGFLKSEWCDYDIKTQVVNCLIAHHQKNLAKLVKRLKTWIDDKIEGYDALVLKYLLENHQLRQAILLLNALVRDGWYGKNVDKDSFATVSRYLRDQAPQASLFESMKLLEVESDRQGLMRVVCDKALLPCDATSIMLVNACPESMLRLEYLKTLVKSFIVSESYDLADATIKSLVLEKRAYWSTIVQCVRRRDFQGIVDHWIAQSHFCHELTEWVVSRWIENMTSMDLIKNFQRVFEYRQSLERPIVMTDESKLDHSMRNYYMKPECDKILLMIIRKWIKLYLSHEKVSILFISNMMGVILPWLKERGDKQEILTVVKARMLELLTENTFAELQNYILLLGQYSLLTTNELDSYINRLIELEMYTQVEDQMHCAPSSDQDFWSARVRERLTGIYINKKMFARVVLLLPDAMNIAERNTLTDCVQRYIKARKIQKVGGLLQKLLNCQYEQGALPLVHSMIEAGYVVQAREILKSHVRTPTQAFALGARLKECYWKRVAIMLNPDGEVTANFIRTASDKITIIKGCLEAADHHEAIRLQTEIVQEMRRQLDIAFMAYCKNTFPDANINYLFFPLVKHEERHDPAGSMELLFSKCRLRDFRRRQPGMFDFLLSIQPVVSRDHQWLETLCPMVNEIKHQGNIELNDVSLPFLIDVVNGVTLILFKLRNPHCDLMEARQYLPKEYVDLPSNQTDSASFQAATKLV